MNYPNQALDTTTWFHVVCTTHRRRQLFKIPATARFCERYLCDECGARNWLVEAVAVAEDRVQLLISIRRRVAREDVVEHVQRAAAEVARHVGAIRPWHRQLWQTPAWCAVLTNRIAVSLVRRHITARSRSGVRSDPGARHGVPTSVG